MFLILGETVREQVLQKVGEANFFSILCDEVCDISNKEQLISFVQYVDQDSGKADIKFLAIDDVLEEYDSANADAIKVMLVKQIAAAKLEKSKLTGLVTDGCSVITGKRNGVAVKMRQECKLLLNVHCICHCICHRLALACGDTNAHVSYIKVVENILVQLWSFFKNSSKRSASYAKAAVAAKSLVVTSKEGKRVVAKKLKKACRTHWLSTEMAIQGIFGDFVPLTQTLRVFKETEGDSTATGLLQQIANIKFLSVVYLLHEVLPPLSHLSKAFQRGTVSFSAIEPAIKYTTDQITEIATEKRPLLRLKEDLREGGRLSGTELTLTQSSESYLENLTVRYINSLKDNITDRFSESLPVLSAFKIFDPTAIPGRSDESFKEYGIREINILAAHFYQEADDQEEKTEELRCEWKKLNAIYFS
ncbi:E3 SUMO-protein ligase KIAA1586-like [Montipora foliosa]|uniref:E3 SUMO-protein ligase KIAA1586-like n=1 Tax=Montipora foliosa TaxID=591990 RepID=UPI0035F15C2D